MQTASFALSKAYALLLADLSYDGKPVKVYDLLAPSGAVAPYVILGPWQPNSDNTKDSFGETGEINLDIVTRFPVGVGSRKPATDIANQITKLIKPTPDAEVLQVEGFKCWNTVVRGVSDLPSQPSGTDTIIRKIIVVEHDLYEQAEQEPA